MLIYGKKPRGRPEERAEQRLKSRKINARGRRRAIAIVSVLATAGTFSLPHLAEGESASGATCELAPGSTRTVTRVIDGETVALDDGRELRLAGILAPRARDADAMEGGWPLEEAARVALADLVLGKQVQIAFATAKQDRYGRLLGHLFTAHDGPRQWIEGELLGRGLARAAALPDDGACLTELLAHERLARADVSGVWRLRLYAPKPALQVAALAGVRSSFQIVRGRVVSVDRTKSAAYLNFGHDWRSDFTVRIPRSVLRRDETWAKALDALKDRTVEVRGWIVRRNGPMISIAHPAELVVPGKDEDLPEPTISQRTPAGATDTPAPATADGPDREQQKQNRPEQAAPGDLNL